MPNKIRLLVSLCTWIRHSCYLIKKDTQWTSPSYEIQLSHLYPIYFLLEQNNDLWVWTENLSTPCTYNISRTKCNKIWHKKQVRCVQFSLELIYILVWFSEHIWSNSCHNHVVLVTHATLVDSCKVFCAIQRLETMSNTTGWLVFNGTSNTDRLRHVHQVKMMTKSYN